MNFEQTFVSFHNQTKIVSAVKMTCIHQCLRKL